jgi:hypothetical protein
MALANHIVDNLAIPKSHACARAFQAEKANVTMPMGEAMMTLDSRTTEARRQPRANLL